TIQPENHDYATDLDLFGKASLFQYINRTFSEQGSRLLAEWMLYPASWDDIRKRQHAAREMSLQIFSLQQFRAYGMANPPTISAENQVTAWLHQRDRFVNNLFWKLVRFIVPLLALTNLILYVLSLIPSAVFYPLVLAFAAIAFGITKSIVRDFQMLD